MGLIIVVMLVAMFLSLLAVRPVRIQILNFLGLIGRVIQVIALGLTWLLTGGSAAVAAHLPVVWRRVRIASATGVFLLVVAILVLVAAARDGNAHLFASILLVLSVPIMVLFWARSWMAGSWLGHLFGMGPSYGLGLMVAFLWWLAEMFIVFPEALTAEVGWYINALILTAGVFWIIGVLKNRTTLVPHWTLAFSMALMLVYSVGAAWVTTTFASEIRWAKAERAVSVANNNSAAAQLEAMSQIRTAHVLKDSYLYTGTIVPVKGGGFRVDNLDYHLAPDKSGKMVREVIKQGTVLRVWEATSPLYANGSGREPVYRIVKLDELGEQVVAGQDFFVTANPEKVIITGPGSTPTPATSGLLSGTAGAPGTNTTISVSATAPWQKTGIMVTAGQTITVSASGTIKWDPTLPAVGPEGAWPIAGLANINDFPYPSGKAGSLLMRVGTEIIEIGTGKTIKISQGGEIHFMPNDRLWALGDNSGAFGTNVGVS